VIQALRGACAVAVLTARELTRQKLWLVFVIIGAGFLVTLPRLSAVDDGARLKLAVLAITSTLGFVGVLMGILVGAQVLRRDLEARTGYLLFSKPLRHSSYLFGRWLGSIVWLFGGLALLSCCGVLAVVWRFDQTPVMRATRDAANWQQVSAVGEVSDIASTKDRISLSGLPGNGLRWRFADLATPGPEGYELLLRTRVTGATPDQPSGEALVEVRAQVGDRWVALPLDKASPYGFDQHANDAGRVVLKSRDNASRDLGQDYLRLRLLPEHLAADGSATIQLTRLESRIVIVVEKDAGILVAVPAGGLLWNILRGALVLLASCGLLAAVALLGATVSNLGVALLAGLTVSFAGSAHQVARETLQWENPGLIMRRLLELMLQVVPDFNRIPVATELAAGRAIPWSVVGHAWIYYGTYAVIALALAWVALRRREL
jgi:ABC-type transport system involved in multi-copper enzyme maturation permease subunit